MQVLNIYLVFDAGNFQSSWEIIIPIIALLLSIQEKNIVCIKIGP